MTSIGDRIRLLMHFKKLNATQLAEIIDVQRSSISHILTGRNKPSLDFVQRVVKEFPEVNYEWLLNGTGKLNQSQPVAKPMDEPKTTTNDTIVTQEDSHSVTNVSQDNPEHVTSVTHPSQEIKNEPEIAQISTPNELKGNKLPRVTKVIIFYDDGSYQEIKQ